MVVALTPDNLRAIAVKLQNVDKTDSAWTGSRRLVFSNSSDWSLFWKRRERGIRGMPKTDPTDPTDRPKYKQASMLMILSETRRGCFVSVLWWRDLIRKQEFPLYWSQRKKNVNSTQLPKRPKLELFTCRWHYNQPTNQVWPESSFLSNLPALLAKQSSLVVALTDGLICRLTDDGL